MLLTMMRRNGCVEGIILLFVCFGVLCSSSQSWQEPTATFLQDTENCEESNWQVVLFGTCTNRTERGFIIVEAVNIHVIRFLPFEHTTYILNEKFCFSKDYLGFIGQRYLLMIGNAPLLVSPLHLLITVSTDKVSYQMNESVHVIVMVENTGKEDAIVFFPDTQIADYQIRDSNDHVIYLWSQNKSFFQVETPVVFRNGESTIILTGEWDQTDTEGNPVSPGIYRLEGLLPPSWYSAETSSKAIIIEIEEA